MMRSAVPLPPSCEDTALVTIVSGIVAVSALEARAIERSKPATFWKPVDDAEHELRPQPERQRPHDALAVHAPQSPALVALVARHAQVLDAFAIRPTRDTGDRIAIKATVCSASEAAAALPLPRQCRAV